MDEQSTSKPFLFYSCAIISFLESRVDTYVENLEPFFEADQETRQWLKDVWLPEEQAHGQMMRAYVEKSWPSFQWHAGFEEFSSLYVPQCATEKLRDSVALEALARCVTETEATMIYRCLASHSADPELSTLLTRMSTDEVRHYRMFKDVHARYESKEKNSFLTKAKTLLARSELVRDEDLALAFKPLNHHWTGEVPFPPWTYADLMKKTAAVIKDHFPFQQATRMLLHPLKTGGRLNRIALDVLAMLAARQFLKYA